MKTFISIALSLFSTAAMACMSSYTVETKYTVGNPNIKAISTFTLASNETASTLVINALPAPSGGKSSVDVVDPQGVLQLISRDDANLSYTYKINIAKIRTDRGAEVNLTYVTAAGGRRIGMAAPVRKTLEFKLAPVYRGGGCP